MGLKLEVGKTYLDRDGNKRGPMREIRYPAWHKFTDGRLSWGFHGGALSGGAECANDLIAEWTDAPSGPVRTVTRKEIVPGVYGGVEVTHVDYATEANGANVCIRIDNGFGPDSLRAAIATLTEIADAMEEQ